MATSSHTVLHKRNFTDLNPHYCEAKVEPMTVHVKNDGDPRLRWYVILRYNTCGLLQHQLLDIKSIPSSSIFSAKSNTCLTLQIAL